MSFWYLRQHVIALGVLTNRFRHFISKQVPVTLCSMRTSVFVAEPLILKSDVLFFASCIPSIMAAVSFNASYLLICVDWQFCVLRVCWLHRFRAVRPRRCKLCQHPTAPCLPVALLRTEWCCGHLMSITPTWQCKLLGYSYRVLKIFHVSYCHTYVLGYTVASCSLLCIACTFSGASHTRLDSL